MAVRTQKVDPEFRKIVSRINKMGNNRREIDRTVEYSNQIRKNTDKSYNGNHSADNPDYGIGTKERMWQNHKWVSRKRGKNGKWIYDYGYGYGKGDPEQLKKNNDKIHKLNNENKRLRAANQRAIDEDYKRHPLGNPSKAAKLYLRDLDVGIRRMKGNARSLSRSAMSKGQSFINKLFG